MRGEGRRVGRSEREGRGGVEEVEGRERELRGEKQVDERTDKQRKGRFYRGVNSE